MELLSFFTTISVISTAVVVLSEYATKFTKAEGKWAQIQSWVISILIGICGSWIDLGIFEGSDWKGGLVMGIVSGLMANGIFTIDLVKQLLVVIGARTGTSAEVKKS